MLDLFLHIVAVGAVEADSVVEAHLPGAFQNHWIVVLVAPEEVVALVSAPVLALALAHPPDVVHLRIHSPFPIRRGLRAAARRTGCSTSCSSPSAASCNASLPVGSEAAVRLHLPILSLVDLDFHLDEKWEDNSEGVK